MTYAVSVSLLITLLVRAPWTLAAPKGVLKGKFDKKSPAPRLPSALPFWTRLSSDEQAKRAEYRLAKNAEALQACARAGQLVAEVGFTM